MADSLAGVALAAGAGARMRPLTQLRPKVLCPVGDRPLIDHALDRLATVTDDVAVNAHHTQPTLVDHLAGRVRHGSLRVSLEDGEALGTAGALAALRDWIDGRPVVVVNGDTWCPGDLDSLLRGWDGERIRVLIPGGAEVGPAMSVAGALMPWSDVSCLRPEPSGLWEVSWADARAAGRIEGVAHDGAFVDCADVADYLHANLLAAGGSVIGAGAAVEGTVVDSVVWPGARVHAHEVLTRAIRTDAGTTVLVRRGRRNARAADS